MVSFLPLNPCDEDSITNLLLQIDNAIQYGEDLDVREMKVTNSNSRSLIFLSLMGSRSFGELLAL